MPCAHAFMCQPSFLPGSTRWENLSPCPSHRTMQVPAAAWSSPEILPPYLTLSCGGHMLSMGKERWLNSFMEATNKCSKNKELFVASWAVSISCAEHWLTDHIRASSVLLLPVSVAHTAKGEQAAPSRGDFFYVAQILRAPMATSFNSLYVHHWHWRLEDI